MKKLSANVCAVTHSGRVRKENEDNYSLNGRLTSDGTLKKGSAYVQKMTEPFHLAVCDGMGGESYGEVASGIAVEAVASGAKSIYSSGENFSSAISGCLEKANSKICEEINNRGKRMGTTLAAVYAVKGKAICVSLGDTRIYHFSKGILEQLSFDHTHAQQIVDAGQVTQQNIGTIPDAKRLTKHLGVMPEEGPLSPNISVIDDVENNDIILLCSDGLTDMLSDAEISAVLSGGESAQDVTGKLIRKALEKGGKDNITVITAFIEAEDSAIFVPIAEAMVGDKDPSYEEEYRNSFGPNISEDDESDESPYANADARASEKSLDKMKILKIAGIALVAIAVIVAAVFIIKAALGGKEEETTTTSLDDYYSSYTQTTVLTTWFTTTEPTTESTTESTTEESTTESTTTTTTRRQTTRRYNTTTRRRTTTTARPTTRTTARTTTTTRPSTIASTTVNPSTTKQGDSTGTTKQGDSTGTTKQGDSTGTTKQGDSTGTTKQGDTTGTTKQGDTTATQAPSSTQSTSTTTVEVTPPPLGTTAAN